MTPLERILQALRECGPDPRLSGQYLMRCILARLLGFNLPLFGSSHCRQARELCHVQQPERTPVSRMENDL